MSKVATGILDIIETSPTPLHEELLAALGFLQDMYELVCVMKYQPCYGVFPYGDFEELCRRLTQNCFDFEPCGATTKLRINQGL